LVSLAQIQEIPAKDMILLVGPPGSGKSTFCQQALLQRLAADRPVIYVTTEYDPAEAVKNLHVKETKCVGMGDPYCEWEFRLT
jgi:KaiC/GvpD/RAD55 family RecA-like ATPase